jgi:hypothetical protein
MELGTLPVILAMVDTVAAPDSNSSTVKVGVAPLACFVDGPPVADAIRNIAGCGSFGQAQLFVRVCA